MAFLRFMSFSTSTPHGTFGTGGATDFVRARSQQKYCGKGAARILLKSHSHHVSRDKDGCTPNVRVPMVFIGFSRDSWGL